MVILHKTDDGWACTHCGRIVRPGDGDLHEHLGDDP